MFPFRFFFFTLLLCTASPYTIAASNANSTIEREFTAKFKRSMNKNKIPGAAFVIVRGDKITAMKTQGVRGKKDKKPITEHTTFRLASVSKTFSAELAALLVSENKFQWQAPLVRYLPEFKLKQSGQAEAITIKHVLSHSSGLMPNAFDGYLKGRFQFDHIIGKFATLEPYCAAGNCYGYQNVLFSFIEEVMKRSTGETYADLMQQRILTPLKMTDSSVGFNAYKNTKNKAHPHIKVSRKGPWHQVKVKKDFYKVAPAAGVNASIHDMSQWLMAQLGHKPEVISEQLLQTVREPVVRTVKELRRKKWRGLLDDAHYGIGWRVYQHEQDTLYFHSGWVEGFRAAIAYSKEKQIGFVLLANAESRAIDDLTVDFWRLLVNESSPSSKK